MSMIGMLTRIPEEVRLALHENPDAIVPVLHSDLEPLPPPKPGLLARILGKKPPPPEPEPEPIHQLTEADSTDLDKTWHALHFLLAGNAWEGDFPQGFLLASGRTVGDVDVGYGPARSFSAEEVKRIAAYLTELDFSALQARFDPEELETQEIYPSGWKLSPDRAADWEYLLGGLQNAAQFVSETARRDMALLVYLV